MNHYQTLGVPRNASAATIKRAYRALVKTHHPDAGGDADRFKEIAQAYATLSDPEKRKRYDATGEDGSIGVDPVLAKRMQTIEAVLDALLGADGNKLRYENIPATIAEVVSDRIKEVTSAINEAKRQRTSLGRLIGRIKTKLPGVEEPISAILQTRMARYDMQIAGSEEDVAMLQGVLEIMDGLVDTPEERATPAAASDAMSLSKYQRLESIIGPGLFGSRANTST